MTILDFCRTSCDLDNFDFLKLDLNISLQDYGYKIIDDRFIALSFKSIVDYHHLEIQMIDIFVVSD